METVEITAAGEIVCGACLRSWGRKKIVGRVAEDGLRLYCRGCREEILLPLSILRELLAPVNAAGGQEHNRTTQSL